MYDEGGWIFILSGKKMQIIIRRKKSDENMTLNMLKISVEFRFYIIFHFIHVKNVEKHLWTTL